MEIKLPPSPSYIYPATSIPPTPSLLSRPASATHLNPSPSPRLTLPTSTSTPILHPRHYPPLTPPTHLPPLRRRRRPLRAPSERETDWLTRTASTLALTRLEEKGQAWLAARGSGTSLGGGEEADDEVSSPRNGGSQRGGAEVVAGPDFVDGGEEGEEEGGEVVDEGEMRRVVLGRVGGWVDWAVGWMDFREGEDGWGEVEEGVEERRQRGGGRERERESGRKMERVEERVGEGEEEVVEEVVQPSPEGPVGGWEDAKWLLGVAKRIAI